MRLMDGRGLGPPRWRALGTPRLRLWWGLAYGGRRFPYGDVCFAYGARLSAYGAASLSMGFATLSC